MVISLANVPRGTFAGIELVTDRLLLNFYTKYPGGFMVFSIAVANQKGGVGKTTSAVSLGAEFALGGSRTLLVDLDPQGSASSGLGVEALPEGDDLYDFFFERKKLSELVKSTEIENLFVIPASRDLVSLELEMGGYEGREAIVRSQLGLFAEDYDYIIFDCPPSSGLLTLNALGASRFVLVPLQAEYYALEGVSSLMDTLSFVRRTFNPDLELLGVFMTMYDGRTNLSAQVEEEARSFFGQRMFDTRIPRSVKLSEAPSHSKPICTYDQNSAGARAYKVLSIEVGERLGKRKQAVETLNLTRAAGE
jgi:chromosome partitioning protein